MGTHREVVRLCREALRWVAVLCETWARPPRSRLWLWALPFLTLARPSGPAWWGRAPAIWSGWGITAKGHPWGHVALHTSPLLHFPWRNKRVGFHRNSTQGWKRLLRLNLSSAGWQRKEHPSNWRPENPGLQQTSRAVPEGGTRGEGRSPAPALQPPHGDSVEDIRERSLTTMSRSVASSSLPVCVLPWTTSGWVYFYFCCSGGGGECDF